MATASPRSTSARPVVYMYKKPGPKHVSPLPSSPSARRCALLRSADIVVAAPLLELAADVDEDNVDDGQELVTPKDAGPPVDARDRQVVCDRRRVRALDEPSDSPSRSSSPASPLVGVTCHDRRRRYSDAASPSLASRFASRETTRRASAARSTSSSPRRNAAHQSSTTAASRSSSSPSGAPTARARRWTTARSTRRFLAYSSANLSARRLRPGRPGRRRLVISLRHPSPPPICHAFFDANKSANKSADRHAGGDVF